MQQIRDAIRTGTEITVRILNYTKQGKPFWNMFTMAPMCDQEGKVRFFVGVQVRWCGCGCGQGQGKGWALRVYLEVGAMVGQLGKADRWF